MKKRTILIFSPDLNFCFSLSTVLQDRYAVVTTTDPQVLHVIVSHHPVDLVVMDAEPSAPMVTRIRKLKKQNDRLPILALYVYTPKGIELDGTVRKLVDGVLYKPFDVDTITERIGQLIVNVSVS